MNRSVLIFGINISLWDIRRGCMNIDRVVSGINVVVVLLFGEQRVYVCMQINKEEQ